MPKKPIIKISTKTGDTGESGLANGKRVAKDSLVFEVVGTLDELNSWLGVLAAHLSADDSDLPANEGIFKREKLPKKHFKLLKQLPEQLYAIQHTLFYIGAELAQSPKAQLANADLQKLERWSNTLQLKLADNWTALFLLPGGTKLGAWADVTRTVCRRCERVTVAYSHTVTVRPIVLKYLNRLSDFLYVVRCAINQEFQYVEKPFIAKKVQK